MTGKIIIYVLVTVLVIWSFDAVNINKIFKQNRVVQATTFYLLITVSLIYLVTNFLMDVFISIKSI